MQRSPFTRFTPATEAPSEARALSRAFAGVAHAIGPSVVRIEVQTARERGTASGIIIDTRGYVVRDALVFARSTPLLTSAPGEQRTARDGWVRLRMTLHADFPLGGGRSVQFFVRVRKPADGFA